MRRRFAVPVIAVVAVGVAVVLVARRADRERSLAPSAVTLVGDSLNLGVEPYLRERLRGWSFQADDEVGIPTEEGVRRLRSAGSGLAPFVVVSLGTNDPASDDDAFRAGVREALRIVGPRRCIVWATVHREGHDGFDAVLRDEAGRNHNLRLVDWSTMIRDHPDWLASDGIHGSPDGYRARAGAVVEALRSCPPSAER